MLLILLIVLLKRLKGIMPNEPTQMHLHKVVVAILQPVFMVHMIARRYGHFVVIVTILLHLLGMAEHLSVLIMRSAPPSSSGLEIQIGSRKCGKVNLTVWFLNYRLTASNPHLTKIKSGKMYIICWS